MSEQTTFSTGDRDESDSRTADEDLAHYDQDFYAEMLIDAAETVCAPLGWRRDRITRYLADQINGSLQNY